MPLRNAPPAHTGADTMKLHVSIALGKRGWGSKPTPSGERGHRESVSVPRLESVSDGVVPRGQPRYQETQKSLVSPALLYIIGSCLAP